MPSEEQITAAASAMKDIALEIGSLPAALYPSEIRKLTRAALEAAERVRAPASFQCADGAALRALHRARALQAIAEHRCSTDLTDGFCGPRDGHCRWEDKGARACIAQAEAILRAMESRGMSVVWDHDPNLIVTMEKRP